VPIRRLPDPALRSKPATLCLEIFILDTLNKHGMEPDYEAESPKLVTEPKCQAGQRTPLRRLETPLLSLEKCTPKTGKLPQHPSRLPIPTPTTPRTKMRTTTVGWVCVKRSSRFRSLARENTSPTSGHPRVWMFSSAVDYITLALYSNIPVWPISSRPKKITRQREGWRNLSDRFLLHIKRSVSVKLQ